VPKFAPGKSTTAGLVGITPLQAADFAAYELLKAHGIGDNLPLYKYRRSILELAKIPAWWGSYTESDLIALCEHRFRRDLRLRRQTQFESDPAFTDSHPLVNFRAVVQFESALPAM
jgi:hypothetical protein